MPAPDGTDTLPTIPSPASTSVSTVGFPLQSKISLANMSRIGNSASSCSNLIVLLFPFFTGDLLFPGVLS